MGVVVGIYLHTGILFFNKGFVRVEAKNSVVLGVTYPGRQTYSAVAFSFLEGLLEGVLLTTSALGLNLPLTLTVVSFFTHLRIS